MDRETELAKRMAASVHGLIKRAVSPLRARLAKLEARSESAFSAVPARGLLGRPRMLAGPGSDDGDLMQRLDALEQRLAALEARGERSEA